MRNLIGICFCLAFFFCDGKLWAQFPGNTDSVEMAKFFQQQAEKWKEAYNSGKGENLVVLYSPDAKYCSSHVNGLVAEGREKLIANFQNGMRAGGHIDSVRIVSLQHSCDLVTLFCEYQATNNGETVKGRNLLVMKNYDDHWLIVLHMTVV